MREQADHPEQENTIVGVFNFFLKQQPMAAATNNGSQATARVVGVFSCEEEKYAADTITTIDCLFGVHDRKENEAEKLETTKNISSSPHVESDRLISAFDSVVEEELTSEAASDLFSCRLCRFSCETRADLVSHHSSGWHRKNVFQKAEGRVILSETEYDELSTSSDSLSDEEFLEIGSATDARSILSKSPYIYFIQGKEGSKKVFCVFRCLISSKCANETERLDELRQLGTMEKWIVILVTGGRFAGAVLHRYEMVAQKTFHRYTVRAKHGGSQTVRDGHQPKNAPKSAGAALRRYNEAALAEDIKCVLLDWNVHIADADFIFLRCSTYHRKIFFGPDGILDKCDTRVKSIPFQTRKPTLGEVKRVHKKLSSVFFCGQLDSFQKSLAEKSGTTSAKEKRRVVLLKKREKGGNDFKNKQRSSRNPKKQEISCEVDVEEEFDNDKQINPNVDKTQDGLYKRQRQQVYTAITNGIILKLLRDTFSQFDGDVRGRRLRICQLKLFMSGLGWYSAPSRNVHE